MSAPPRQDFRRSSYCGDGSCVEVSTLADGTIALRDSKNLELPHHVYTRDEWTAFVLGVKSGEFDFGLPTDLSAHPLSA